MAVLPASMVQTSTIIEVQTMTRTTLLLIGFLGSLAVTTAIASETSYGADDSAGKSAAGEQTRESARTSDRGPEQTTPGETATEKGEAKTGAGGSAGGTRSANAGQSKPAGSGTAAKHIYDQVKKGNIKIQGATDADIYQ
jgi:hypothetical protein